MSRQHRSYRLQGLHLATVASGLAITVWTSAIVAMSSGTGTILAVDIGPVPFVVLLIVAVPTTTWLCRHAMMLAGMGGAVHIAFDTAVMTLLLWGGLGAVDALTTDADDRATLAVTTGAIVFLVWLAGVVVSGVTGEGRRPLIRAFNVGMSTIGGAGYVAVSLAVRGLPSDALPAIGLGPRDILAVLLATTIYVLVDTVFTGASVAWDEDKRIRDAIGDPSAVLAAGAVLAINSAVVLAATLLAVFPWAPAFLVPGVVMLVYAANVGTVATTERRRTLALYEAATACQVARDDDAAVAAILLAVEEGVAAAASIADTPPTPGQIGAPITTGDRTRWLIADPRAAGHSFVPEDDRALATLAALTEQTLTRIAALARIRQMAEHDDLTGLMNRRTFTEVIRTSVETGSPTSVLFCDLDDFKGINDAHGHGVGDTILGVAADRIRQTIRPEDVAARLGGDEFAILLAGADEGQAAVVRRRVLASIDQPVDVTDRQLSFGMSIGTATATWLPPVDRQDGGRKSLDRPAERRRRRHVRPQAAQQARVHPGSSGHRQLTR